MTVIKYTIGDEKDLDRIRPMWERLNLHHISLAKHFKTDYKKMKFTVFIRDIWYCGRKNGGRQNERSHSSCRYTK
jgi:IS1 family transposase